MRNVKVIYMSWYDLMKSYFKNLSRFREWLHLPMKILTKVTTWLSNIDTFIPPSEVQQRSLRIKKFCNNIWNQYSSFDWVNQNMPHTYVTIHTLLHSLLEMQKLFFTLKNVNKNKIKNSGCPEFLRNTQ